MTEFKCAYCGHKIHMVHDVSRNMYIPDIDIDEQIIDYDAGTVCIIGSSVCDECDEQTMMVLDCKIEDTRIMTFEDFQGEDL